jgi:hypothetical protein
LISLQVGSLANSIIYKKAHFIKIQLALHFYCKPFLSIKTMKSLKGKLRLFHSLYFYMRVKSNRYMYLGPRLVLKRLLKFTVNLLSNT